MNQAWYSSRPGLAGGIDKDGSRAAELLTSGFASVEFGTVTPRPEFGGNPGISVLVEHLAVLPPRSPSDARIGIGIGMGCSNMPTALASDWLSGCRAAWPIADYLSFNLSARRYQPLLTTEYLPLLLEALASVASERPCQTVTGSRYVALALKLPLGSGGTFPLVLAQAAVDAGFDAVIAVLPAGAERLDRLSMLAARLHGRAAIVAVGGIRTAEDVRAALTAGANAVQVHSAFAQFGASCLPVLLGPSCRA